MSFSLKVKEEMLSRTGNGRHCQLAELAAFVQFFGEISKDKKLIINTDNEIISRKCFTLLKKTFNILAYEDLKEGDLSEEILRSLKFGCSEGKIQEDISHILLKSSCCRASYLRGVFLSAGSITNPEKGYHLEIVCPMENLARGIQDALLSFGLRAKTILRKNDYVIYLKDSDEIVEFLGICDAHVALMELENTRIYKDVRNDINRRVNCETANIAKTITASTRQMDGIQMIQEKIGLDNLPEALREIAEVRMENPDASLAELGQLLTPPLGKSGVNHRLRKLDEIAKNLK